MYTSHDARFDSLIGDSLLQLSPSPGMMESIIVLVSFHYLFVTKVDRAFEVKCMYSQLEDKVLDHSLNIRCDSPSIFCKSGQGGSLASSRTDCRFLSFFQSNPDRVTSGQRTAVGRVSLRRHPRRPYGAGGSFRQSRRATPTHLDLRRP